MTTSPAIVGKSIIDNLAADVRFEASIMEGTVTGRAAVTRILRAAGSLYETVPCCGFSRMMFAAPRSTPQPLAANR